MGLDWSLSEDGQNPRLFSVDGMKATGSRVIYYRGMNSTSPPGAVEFLVESGNDQVPVEVGLASSSFQSRCGTKSEGTRHPGTQR